MGTTLFPSSHMSAPLLHTGALPHPPPHRRPFPALLHTGSSSSSSPRDSLVIMKEPYSILYKCVMPNNEIVAIKYLPAMRRGSSHDHGFNAEI
ncbi:hypothetical protein R6Q59_012356 [Mikania micrantha]